MITLEHLLDSRDARSRMQQQLLSDNPGQTLVCLTVVMPGNVKRNEYSLKLASAAVEAIQEVFGEINVVRDLDTGYEAYLITSIPAEEAKIMACNIEDSHPLGRLFDIDILNTEKGLISRSSLGLPNRKCLICGDDARVCMRVGRHSYEELLKRIENLVDNYGLRSRNT